MPPSVSQNEPYGSQQTIFLIPCAYQTQVVSSYCYRHPCLITSGPTKVGPPGLSTQKGCPEIRKVRGDLVLKPGFFTFSIKEHPSYYSLPPSAAVPHGNREFPQFHGVPRSHPSHGSADGQNIRGAIRISWDYTPHPARSHPGQASSPPRPQHSTHDCPPQRTHAGKPPSRGKTAY